MPPSTQLYWQLKDIRPITRGLPVRTQLKKRHLWELPVFFPKQCYKCSITLETGTTLQTNFHLWAIVQSYTLSCPEVREILFQLRDALAFTSLSWHATVRRRFGCGHCNCSTHTRFMAWRMALGFKKKGLTASFNPSCWSLFCVRRCFDSYCFVMPWNPH